MFASAVPGDTDAHQHRSDRSPGFPGRNPGPPVVEREGGLAASGGACSGHTLTDPAPFYRSVGGLRPHVFDLCDARLPFEAGARGPDIALRLAGGRLGALLAGQRRHQQKRTRVLAPFATACTGRRLTFQRRLLTLWAWLILFPNCGPLPQISQTLAMSGSSRFRLRRASEAFRAC